MTPDSEAVVAGCQFEPVIGDLPANYETISALAASLNEDVAVAVFPELCVTGYDIDVAREHAAPVPGDLTDPLVDIAAEADTTLVVGLPERAGETLYNDLVVVDEDGVAGTYRKQYLWGAEDEMFETGGGPITVETEAGTVGFLVCYDLNFPEAALAYADKECDVLAVSSAWRESYRSDWRLLLRARALDGTCFVVGANHSGEQDGRIHAGTSLVAGPDGSVLTDADGGRATVEARVSPKRLQEGRDRNPVHEICR